MMLPLIGNIGAPWLIGGAVVVGGIVLWKTYTLGYAVAESHYLKEIEKTREIMLERQATQISLAVQQAERSMRVRSAISAIDIPDGCVVSAECLQPFNDAVRAANSGGADPAPASNEGG